MERKWKGRSGMPERRVATRYSVTLRMEIWPEHEPRKPHALFVNTHDISMRGIYFSSDMEYTLGSRLNFSVIFLREFSGKDADLIAGTARIVRCDLIDAPATGTPRFAVALSIERTTHVHGE